MRSERTNGQLGVHITAIQRRRFNVGH